MNSNGETIIEVNNLVRRFGDRAVLDDISFNVHRGETLVIMGGSGCGKSTMLRHMIGSMKPTSGSVKLFGEEITGMKEREIERVRLRFGMLFQSGALLASLEPFARHKVNLLKIESRPIHGRPWEYQFFLDVEAERPEPLGRALIEVRQATADIRVLGLYAAAKTNLES